MSRLQPVVAAFSFLVMLCAGNSNAEWRMSRHNVSRTGLSPGIAHLSQPQVRWRFSLGGFLKSEDIASIALPNETRNAIVLISANRVVVKREDNALIWRSPDLGPRRLVGVVDLDQNGTFEILTVVNGAARDARIEVHDGSDGTLLWRTPKGLFGEIWSGVRLVNVIGDSRPELYVTDLGTIGGYRNSALFSFDNGIIEAYKVWDLESITRDYYYGGFDAIGDFNGDGVKEILAQGHKELYLFSTKTGKLIYKTPKMTSPVPFGIASIWVANLDDDPAPEIISMVNGPYTESQNARRIVVYDWDAADQRLSVLWERSVANLSTDQLQFNGDSVIDLTNDNRPEIVVSLFENGGWRTVVLSAATGEQIAAIDDIQLQGVAGLGPGNNLIIGKDSGGEQQLRAYRFSPGSLVETGLLGSGVLLTCLPRSPISGVLNLPQSCITKLTSNGTAGFFIGRLNGFDLLTSVDGFVAKTPTEAPIIANTLNAPTGHRATGWQLLSGVVEDDETLALAFSSGRLWLLDRDLKPTNVTDHPQFPVLGINFSSYYSGANNLNRFPVGANLFQQTPQDEIAVLSASGKLLVLDAVSSTLVSPPTIKTEISGVGRVVISRGTGNNRRLLVETRTSLQMHLPGGEQIWSRTLFQPITIGRTAYNDPITADLDSDQLDDVVYQVWNRDGNHYIVGALNGKDGEPLWQERVLDTNNFGWRRLSLGDVDSDPGLEILTGGIFEIWHLDADSGTTERKITASRGYFTAIVGDTVRTMMSAGFDNVQLFDAEFEPVWSTANLSRHAYGAVVSCGDTKYWVVPLLNSPTLRSLNLSDGSQAWIKVFTDGKRFDNEQTAELADALLGVLGNVNGIEKLSSTDKHPSVLFGSTDGYLYAVNPCTAELRWALPFGAAVGEPILLDTDGDGLVEIVVSVADGYIYGVDTKQTDAPAEVLDTDPPNGIVDSDVDEIETNDRLYAKWSPVDGATSYEIAVFTADGALVSAGFLNVGNVTTATLSGLPLIVGLRYVVAVRALSPFGSSPETLSDGVKVIKPVVEPVEDEDLQDGNEPDSEDDSNADTGDDQVEDGVRPDTESDFETVDDINPADVADAKPVGSIDMADTDALAPSTVGDRGATPGLRGGACSCDQAPGEFPPGAALLLILLTGLALRRHLTAPHNQ